MSGTYQTPTRSAQIRNENKKQNKKTKAPHKQLERLRSKPSRGPRNYKSGKKKFVAELGHAQFFTER